MNLSDGVGYVYKKMRSKNVCTKLNPRVTSEMICTLTLNFLFTQHFLDSCIHLVTTFLGAPVQRAV